MFRWESKGKEEGVIVDMELEEQTPYTIKEKRKKKKINKSSNTILNTRIVCSTLGKSYANVQIVKPREQFIHN